MGQNEQRALLVAIFALAFSTLALASAPRWAACVSAALAVLAVVPLAGSRRVLEQPQPLLLLMAIPFAATLLQLLPLPAGLVSVVAPARYALAAANAHAYDSSIATFMPLSQDWPATLVELSKFAGYFAFAYVSTRLCASRRARRWLLVAVCSVGAVVAVCALGHRAAGAKTLLGIYTPSSLHTSSIAPFLNPNHLAGYLALVAPVSLGLAIHRRSLLFVVITILLASTSIQATSRGGLVALCLGIAVTLVLAAKSRTNSRAREGWLSLHFVVLGLVLVLACVALFGATAGRELLNLDFAYETHTGKFQAWRSVPSLITSSPWFGVGRGAFESSFTRVQPNTDIAFSHIENEYLQVILDWGLPTALAIAVALVLLARAVIRRSVVDGLAAGAIGGVAAVLVQSLVDFGLELPGIALPAIAVVASLLPGALVVEEDKRRRKRLAMTRLAAVAAAVVACALAASSLGAPPEEELAAKPEFDPAYSGPAENIIVRAAGLSRRHPSSYLVPAETAAALLRMREAKAFAALGRALELNPNHYGVHLLAAHLLESSQKPRQALAEYRAALTVRYGPRQKILDSLVTHFSATEDLVLAIPEGPRSDSSYARLFLAMKRADVAEALARRALLLSNKSYDMYEIAVQAALANQHVSWAVETSKEAHDRFLTSKSLMLYVSSLRAGSLPLIAIAALEENASRSSASDLEVLDMLCRLRLDTQDFVSARKTASLLLLASSASIPFRKSAHLYLATIEEHEGNRHQATWHKQQAADLRER